MSRLSGPLAAVVALLALGIAHPARACFGLGETGALLVAPSGDDNADGSVAAPFRTLERARDAMRGGKARRTFIEGGHYASARPLLLDSRDSSTQYIACPGQQPELDGRPAGLGTLLEIIGAHDVTVRGLGFTSGSADVPTAHLRGAEGVRLEFGRFRQSGAAIVLDLSRRNTICANSIIGPTTTGIELKDGSDDNLIVHNVVDGARTRATHGGGIFVHGARGVVIAHNLIENGQGAGIVVANWDDRTLNIGIVIANNTVRNVNRSSQDSGAIYMLGRSHADVRSRIVHNLIDGAGEGGDAHAIGIYLDDSTSGVTVEENLLRNVGAHAIQIHGGDDVLIQRNLLDLGADGATAVLFQAAPADTNPTNTMRGNVVRENVVLMTGSPRPPFTFIEGGVPTIAGNTYILPGDWTARPNLRDDDPMVLEGNRAERPAAALDGQSFGPSSDGPDSISGCGWPP